MARSGDTGSVDELLSGHGRRRGRRRPRGGADDISAAADNELVKLVNKIIIDAYRQGASRHPHRAAARARTRRVIRFRKDGSLEPYIEIPASYRNALVGAHQDHVRPRHLRAAQAAGRQDQVQEIRPARHRTARGDHPDRRRRGRHRHAHPGRRRADPARQAGLLPHNLERLQDSRRASPTACSSCAARPARARPPRCTRCSTSSNTPDTKIWTAEDPVEITQNGLRQVQVNRKIGLDFRRRRCAPSCAPIRTSSWSAKCATRKPPASGIEASLTGHLVFATLHTNSAPESIVRLLDMGMDPFNFADALLGVLAQRLAKRVVLATASRPITRRRKKCSNCWTNTARNCRTPRRSRKIQHAGEAGDPRLHGRRNYADDNGSFTLYQRSRLRPMQQAATRDGSACMS